MGDCGVCCSGDYEFAEHFEIDPECKTRKHHKCCECGNVIPKGSICERIRMLFEHQWRTYHTCAICSEIAEAFQCEARVPQWLWESMYEVMDALTTSCFDRLKTLAAKNELQRRWIEWKFDR